MLPACAELAQTVESVLQLLSAGRQGVADLRPRRRLGFAVENARLFQTAQLLGQHILGKSRKRAFDSAEVKRLMLANPVPDAGQPVGSREVQGAGCAAAACRPVF